MPGGTLPDSYNGYTSCPLTVGDGKLVLAEFGYDGAILETLPINQAKVGLVFTLVYFKFFKY